jgi:hypothetical protein
LIGAWAESSQPETRDRRLNMSRIPVAVAALLAAFALPTSAALAQVVFGPQMSGPNGTPMPGSANQGGIDDVRVCQAAPGGSRVRRNNNCQLEEPETVVTELKAPRREPAAPSAPACEATTLTEYSQRGATARVAGTVSVANCPAGTAGNFTLVARVKDEAGEIKPIEWSEAWQRDDALDVAFAGDYPIGDDVELVSVRVRNLTCTCAQPDAAPPAAEAADAL